MPGKRETIIEGPIELGDRVREKITGLEGIVTAITTWLNGCVRVGVQPEKLKDGKISEAAYFDDGQVVIIKKGVHKPVIMQQAIAPPTVKSKSGGPARETTGFSR